jgi:hypothetical protein
MSQLETGLSFMTEIMLYACHIAMMKHFDYSFDLLVVNRAALGVQNQLNAYFCFWLQITVHVRA